jgi:hypothetical protein
MRVPSLSLLLACATVLGAPIAAADPVPLDLKAARDLFTEAERDEDAGRWPEAEQKLRRVAQVKFSAGVRYHLALCDEREGRLVAALAGFEAARDQARREDARDVSRLVEIQLAELTPRVPRIVIHPSATGADAVVSLDGVALEAGRLGEPLPVDPGEHRIEATSPGRRPATATPTLHERDALVIDLPPGELLPPTSREEPAAVSKIAHQPASAGASTATAPRPAPVRVAAIATTATAAALAGGGVAAFFVAGSAHAQGVRDCAAVVVASPGACDSKRDLVRAWDWVAIGGWSAAAIAAAGAFYLWTRPAPRSRQASSMRLEPLAGPGWVGIAGSF